LRSSIILRRTDFLFWLSFFADDSLYINCGGANTVFDGKEFEGDSATLNYYNTTKGNWAYSCSGDFGSETYDSTNYIKNVECGDCDPSDSAATQLYNSSRLCPLSLTYYGFCLFEGNYTVKLYFAETVYQNDEDYSILGKRVFDVYIQVTAIFFCSFFQKFPSFNIHFWIQGKRELTDFNIKENATGTNRTQNFTAHVVDDHLLTIHFFWAGKGSFQVPGYSYSSTAALSLNGPLVAGISVTASKELHSLNFVDQRFLLHFIWINIFFLLSSTICIQTSKLARDYLLHKLQGLLQVQYLLLYFCWLSCGKWAGCGKASWMVPLHANLRSLCITLP